MNLNNYSGITTVRLTDEQLNLFYQEPTNNFLNLDVNEYVVIEFDDAEPVTYHWDGEKYTQVQYRKFVSNHFGDIRPKNKDPYQMAYMDSLVRNQLTFCTGPAGSGKTQIALAYAFQEYEKGKIDRIVIFANPYVAQGAVKLGFMPGTKVDKLLETSIGSILISKIGDRGHLEDLIARGHIVLMPMGDARGFEVPDNSFVYFSEAQNTSKYLMKLFLQRTNDNCKICVEGDVRQVDSDRFENDDNGLERAIEVFRGEDYAGCVQLKTIYRGKIARKAEEICD